MKQQIIDWYLDWVNNWLTVECFAEYYGISEDQALTIIDLGRQLHEESPTEV